MKVQINIRGDAHYMTCNIPDNLSEADQVAKIKEIVLKKVRWSWERI
jgi:hypothetical protein